MTILDWTYRLLRWCLGTVFIYAGGLKLMDPEVFAVLISAYGILPDAMPMPVAVLLPAIEVLAGIGLLFDLHGSLAAVTGLLVLFIGILAYGIQMGLDVDCGCFGPEDPEAKAFHGLRTSLYRDLLMFSAAVGLYGWRRYRAIRPIRIPWRLNHKWKRRSAEDAFI